MLSNIHIQIRDGEPCDIERIAQDDAFIRYMMECGETRLLTVSVKFETGHFFTSSVFLNGL